MARHTRDAQSGIPLAYFVTVTTYGSWLPGDQRGWTDHHRARPGEPRALPSAALDRRGRADMSHDTLLLDPDMRLVIKDAIRDTCAEAGWALLALAVRSNHFHALVANGATAGQTLSRLKGVSTRTLHRNGFVEAEQPVWSKQDSTRYLWKARSVVRVKYYIKEMQDDVSTMMPWSAGD